MSHAAQAMPGHECSTKNLMGSGAPAFLRLIFRVRWRPFTPASTSLAERWPACQAKTSSYHHLGGAPYKGLSKMASLSSVQFNQTQGQTNQVALRPDDTTLQVHVIVSRLTAM